MAKGEVDIDTGSDFQHEALIYEDSGAVSGGRRSPSSPLPSRPANPPWWRCGRRTPSCSGRSSALRRRGWASSRSRRSGATRRGSCPSGATSSAGRAGRPARGISEPVWPGREAAEIDECQRHEYLLNLAFPPGTRSSLLCAYDGSALPDEVLAAVFRSHRAVLRDGSREPSGSYRRECDCYGGELPRHPPDAETLPYDRARLAAVRKRVKEAAEQAGIGPRRAADLVAAASELAANSVAHGGGAGTMYIWREGDHLLIDFEDRGTIEEPLAGRLHPTTDQRGGRGLWLANQLCDLVQIRSGALGTTVRVQAGVA